MRATTIVVAFFMAALPAAAQTGGFQPALLDVSMNQVWYGALRITQYKFFYTSPGAHTMESRGGPNPAKAVAKALIALAAALAGH
jgi:hypothetical protein